MVANQGTNRCRRTFPQLNVLDFHILLADWTLVKLVESLAGVIIFTFLEYLFSNILLPEVIPASNSFIRSHLCWEHYTPQNFETLLHESR